MAQLEPMDVDCMASDFDNKENTFHHNVPCTEKGYEELDVSELNMKLRYSITPASSPMSKSYTACPDNRYLETGDALNSNTANLTRSLNSTMKKNDNVIKSLKSLPLQSIGTEQFADGNSSTSIFRQQGSDDANITVTISGTNHIDENLSLPSSSSSALHTPETTTPTNEIKDEGSPIIRGIKSVLNMFRTSTSPVPPTESDNITVKQEVLSPENLPCVVNSVPVAVASTPIAAHRTKDCNSSKRSSPYKDSIIFNEDLEKELNWKDEKTVSSPEKMPISKLLLQTSKTLGNKADNVDLNTSNTENNFYSVVEYMDISNNESIVQDRTMTDCHMDSHDVSAAVESDGEFVDCETTFSKNESYVLDIKGIQEKISSNENLNETKQVDTTKCSKFVDCDSTISKNDSYVLDIKEIHEKISAKVNLCQTKQTSFITENIPTGNHTFDANATNMSFIDLDLKFDTTLPKDYSDYSQATTDILSALEKLEASQIDEIKQTNMQTYTKNTEQKDVTGLYVEATKPINVTLDKNLGQNNEATESQENQLSNTGNMCDELDTTLTEPNANISQSDKPKMIESLESQLDTRDTVKFENKSLHFQEVNVQINNSNVGCENKLAPFYNVNANQTLETINIQNCNLSENKNITDTEIISTECTETPFTISNSIAEAPLYVMSNVIQNDAMPIEVVNSDFNYVPSEALSVTLSNINQESFEIPPADLPLPEDDIVEPLLSTLDVAQNVTTKTTDGQITDFFSDVPLPSDDADEKHLTSKIITSGETVQTSNSEIIITSEFKVIDTVPVVVNALVENTSSNDFISTYGISEAQLFDSTPDSIDSELSGVKTLKTLSENQFKNNETILLKHNSLLLKTDSHLLLKQPALTNPDLKISESIENTRDKLPENMVDDNMLNEIVPLDTIIDNSVVDANQVINDYSNNLIEGIVSIDNSAHNLNLSEIEPMDITLNECLNMTQELPDLVNQTFLLVDDKIPEQILNDIFNEPNQIELPPNTSDEINDSNLITGNVLKTIKCTSDLEAKTILMNKISMDECITNISEENMVPNLPINQDKWSARETQNTASTNLNISSISSDDQPPIIFTNTPDPEAIENEGTTVDEEIIVSANNSPYVSLMSDLKPFPEKKQDADKIEKPSNIDEQVKIIEPGKIKGSEKIKEADKIEEPEKIEDPIKTEKSEIIEEPLNNEKSELIEEPLNNEKPEKNEKAESITEPKKYDELEKNEEPEKVEEPKTIEEPVKTEDEDAFENIENSFVSKSNVAVSPPITSKGYNFNFDDMDDPFATKTKIRLSPPLDTSNKSIEADKNKDEPFKVTNKGAPNRRKSQPPERKKPIINKKKNTSFDAKSKCKVIMNKTDSTVTINEDKANTNDTTEYKQVLEIATKKVIENDKTVKENVNEIEDMKEDQGDLNIESTLENTLQASKENKLSIGSGDAILSDLKTTSSSEQSTYYSAGASSTESFHSKNVFNLPEIDDVNFNPFATKSKIRQSPTQDIDIENPFVTRSKMRQSPPLITDIDNTFTTRSKIRSSTEVSIINHSTDTTGTVTLNDSNLAQIANNVDDEDKMETELMEKNSSANIADTTSSPRATDNQNLTTQEVNTEDEDTIEGPFLDAGDEIEKITDFTRDKDDVTMLNELQDAAHATDDNLDGELFIDAEAFEFLLNQNKSNVVADSGKESLFLKFDPLFAKRISSDGVLASLNKAQKRQSTPTKPNRPSLRNKASPIAGPSTTSSRPRPSIRTEMSPLTGPSTLNITYEGENNVSQESNDDANITVTKPMMVVTPALNPAVTPRNKSITTPAISNRRSITFTSPAIAVIDRLLLMSGNNSIVGLDSTSTLSNSEQTEADLALTQLRELLAEKEISVYNLRSESKELKDRLSAMESQVKTLEADGQARLKKINELNERLIEKTKMNKSMASVVEEYERTIASLIADIEQDKKQKAEERIRLIKERDEQTAHLTSMEVSFSDLHSKYEKSKQVILACKANEDLFKKTIQDFEEQATKMQTNYEMLKQHATAKLNHANQELEKINRAHETEVVKLNAMIKRNQLLATSLQETLAQKTKANDELTAICDELINKVGSNK